MPKDAFFNNIGTILTYAVIGTLFNSFATGLSLWGVYKADLMPGLNEVHEQELGKWEKLTRLRNELIRLRNEPKKLRNELTKPRNEPLGLRTDRKRLRNELTKLRIE